RAVGGPSGGSHGLRRPYRPGGAPPVGPGRGGGRAADADGVYGAQRGGGASDGVGDNRDSRNRCRRLMARGSPNKEGCSDCLRTRKRETAKTRNSDGNSPQRPRDTEKDEKEPQIHADGRRRD